ncbi:PAS domain S-box protein [Desulfomonile tiedjei]|uniref:PAS domain S-box n=1 Tax=Desulfomonile tiedjei (strain ATCC 49306 / DSM 6799 / DCB-1) TaxID=706587 RepID=I4C1X0_DESTA|nr:PAS domain S-box protein [Desulfomonile tiedjei]AFM23561.1 PAS domain S-box [Desulfomonile tiedjei DSM 6799]
MTGATKHDPAARILICANEPGLTRDVAETLRDLGYNVAGITSTGQEALKSAEKMHPDLVLMDIGLPGEIDGIDAALMIHSRLDIPVIYLAAGTEESILERARKSEPYGYLSKPIHVPEMRSVIEFALYKHEADRKLRESEERFRSLIEQASDAIFVHDFHGRFLEVNQQACISSGYSRDELLSLSVGDLDPDMEKRGDSSRFWPNLPATFESTHRRKDGTTFPVEIRLGPIEYGNTKVILSLVRDIAERKGAAKILQESEKRFRTIFQTSPDSICINRLSDGAYVDVNAGFSEIYGFKKEEVIGKSSLQINIWKNPTDRERIIDGLKEFGHVNNLEIEFRRRDGVLRSGLVSARIVELNGEHHILSVTRDVEDWKKDQLKLQEKTSLLNSLIEALPDVIYFKDLDRRHLLVNKAFEDFFGVNGQEVIGRTVEEFFLKDDTLQSRTTDEEVMATKAPLIREQSWIDRKGGTHIVDTRKFPIFDHQGNIMAIGGISRDITERKKAEERIKASLKEKEVLLREIHHRVRNNLALIQSLLRIQSHHVRNSEFSRMLEDTQHRIRSMAFCHELLYKSENVSSIRTDEYLGNLLKQLRESLSIVGKKIEIRQQIAALHLSIEKAFPLGFILTELISNCYQHAFPEVKNGEIVVVLRLLKDSDLEFVVRDDGIGLPEDTKPQESQSLGYHLVRIFVRQLNGSIDIVNDKGTEVRIKFPLE